MRSFLRITKSLWYSANHRTKEITVGAMMTFWFFKIPWSAKSRFRTTRPSLTCRNMPSTLTARWTARFTLRLRRLRTLPVTPITNSQCKTFKPSKRAWTRRRRRTREFCRRSSSGITSETARTVRRITMEALTRKTRQREWSRNQKLTLRVH